MGKCDGIALAREIEALHREQEFDKFPYSDCWKLKKLMPDTAQDLAPDFNAYFMFIDGYSSYATTLGSRPLAELQAALPKPKKSFFDLHPQV
jgi:hypothetical protein